MGFISLLKFIFIFKGSTLGVPLYNKPPKNPNLSFNYSYI